MVTELERKYMRLLWLELAIIDHQFNDSLVCSFEQEREELCSALVNTESFQKYAEEVSNGYK